MQQTSIRRQTCRTYKKLFTFQRRGDVEPISPSQIEKICFKTSAYPTLYMQHRTCFMRRQLCHETKKRFFNHKADSDVGLAPQPRPARSRPGRCDRQARRLSESACRSACVELRDTTTKASRDHDESRVKILPPSAYDSS